MRDEPLNHLNKTLKYFNPRAPLRTRVTLVLLELSEFGIALKKGGKKSSNCDGGDGGDGGCGHSLTI